tara:strand:+ start:2159 stop:2644 length:486 start_codon:yes stop_codon:yes gene_type:complete
MRLILNRYIFAERQTVGLLHLEYDAVGASPTFLCDTLEDRYRGNGAKVYGETAIPNGLYDIRLRTEGGMTQRYATRFPHDHKGMLHLQDVPGFEWVYIHMGNSDEHTEGCILVGSRAKIAANEWRLAGGSSAIAYHRLYTTVVDAAAADNLTIDIKTMEVL